MFKLFKTKNSTFGEGNALKKPEKKKGSFKLMLSKLSGAFMLPISLLAFAGILMGVGNAITSHSDATTFGAFVENIGSVSFGILPLLFCISIAIAYSGDQAVAGFAAVVGWMTFNGLCNVLLFPNAGTDTFSIFGWSGVKIYGDISAQLLTNNQGFQSFNTSVFGAIGVGALIAWIYNHFSNIELPMVISFFSGKRFVPIMAAVFMVPVCFLFTFTWPLIGRGLQEIGTGLAKAPASINSLFFGYIERSLVPFGLQHVFYAPLWWTAAGGDITQEEFANAISGDRSSDLAAIANGTAFANVPPEISRMATDFLNNWNNQALQKPFGDVYIWFFMNRMPADIAYMNPGDTAVHHLAAFKFTSSELGINVGQYMQGKYPFMIFGLPAVAAAIVMAAPRQNRKMAASVAISAVASSFISGITEPIEFTFLFLAPWLYWGVHATFAALSFWFMTLFGAHIGMVFSGGLIDLTVYGLIPLAHGTNAWLVFIMGPIYVPIYFFTFYFCIKRFNIETPGRGSNTKFFAKGDLKEFKTKGSKGELSMQNQMLVAGMGGWENITSYGYCATRLRYSLNDVKKIDRELITRGGAWGVMMDGEHGLEVVIGPRASIVNQQISNAKGAPITIDRQEMRKMEVKKDDPKATGLATPITLLGVAEGTVKSITKVTDKLFADKTIGDGVAVVPTSGKVYAPIDGKIISMFPTKHAYGIETAEGVEILIHIGIDTVKLNGDGFTNKVKQGDSVKAGDLIAVVDLEKVQKAGYETDILVVVLNESRGRIRKAKTRGAVTPTTPLFEVY